MKKIILTAVLAAMSLSLLCQDRDSLARWYMHRHSVLTADPYDMDSVRFSTDVPDSVLMARLSAMNSFITLPYNETVKNYMILYSEKMPRRMEEVLGLGAYYFPIFEETFDRYGLPLELKYMAVIESMLNPRAESRAGAKGLWQFMYRTALGYGLRVDSFIDERRTLSEGCIWNFRQLAPCNIGIQLRQRQCEQGYQACRQHGLLESV